MTSRVLIASVLSLWLPMSASMECADSDACCTNGAFTAAGEVCRPAQHDECDLAETCTGKMGDCPVDLYKSPGTSCTEEIFPDDSAAKSNADGKCYRGECISQDSNCLDPHTGGAYYVGSTPHTSYCESYSNCIYTYCNDGSLMDPCYTNVYSSPARDGTECGSGKRCRTSSCVDEQDLKDYHWSLGDDGCQEPVCVDEEGTAADPTCTVCCEGAAPDVTCRPSASPTTAVPSPQPSTASPSPHPTFVPSPQPSTASPSPRPTLSPAPTGSPAPTTSLPPTEAGTTAQPSPVPSTAPPTEAPVAAPTPAPAAALEQDGAAAVKASPIITLLAFLLLIALALGASDPSSANMHDPALPAHPYWPPSREPRRLEREAWNDDGDAVESCGACCFVVASNDGSLDPFYAKVVDVAGFKVASSSAVRDAAVLEAAYTLARMTRNRPDLVATLVAEGVHMAVIGEDEVLTDIPGYAGLGSGWDWTRGVGATQWYPITSCAEENLLCLRDDVYAREDICVHETAHSLQGSGGKLPTQRLTLLTGGEDLDAAIDTLYDSAMSDGLFDNTYAASNHEEYWAEGVQAYFGTNVEGPVGGDGVHNQIDTRAELQAYDPPLFDLIHGIFPDDVDISCPETAPCDCSDAGVQAVCAAFSGPVAQPTDPTVAPTTPAPAALENDAAAAVKGNSIIIIALAATLAV